MKAFIDGFISDSALRADFKKTARMESLTEDMAQAFYRREYDTVDLLAQKGARFTEEMLVVAIRLHDARLVQRCLHAGVIPNDEMICRAVDAHDAPLVHALTQNAPLNPGVKDYVAHHGTPEIRQDIAQHA